MRATGALEYGDLSAARGPLVFVHGVDNVGYDELAWVTLDGEEPRRGVVLEVDRDLAVVQIYEGTRGLSLDSTRIRFAGEPLRIPVGDGWMGRICNGRGEPVDGGPPVFGQTTSPVVGAPLNPARRRAPRDPILTGVSCIDGLSTLVRGQKLPIFSHGGLPHLELAAQVAVQARALNEPFRVVFCAMGITHADAEMVTGTLETRAASGELALFINTADDPVIERLLTPRLALTVAEHMAYDLGHHVLVIMSDMTAYCEAVREVSASRGEVPGRRGYPGFLYSDLASLYERSGIVADRPGSLTQLPVLTMPAGDITHPVPDLTGYITEGQVVLSPDLFARGVDPPFDPLASLSRLMRRGAGPGKTRQDHLDLANQLYAALARARQAQELSELVGADALSETDRLFIRYAIEFEEQFLTQGREENRSLVDTLDRGWRAMSRLPRRELTMVSSELLDAYYREAGR